MDWDIDINNNRFSLGIDYLNHCSFDLWGNYCYYFITDAIGRRHIVVVENVSFKLLFAWACLSRVCKLKPLPTPTGHVNMTATVNRNVQTVLNMITWPPWVSQIRATALKLTGAATFTSSRHWLRRTHRPLFDINGGEVHGLELAPGMPSTAQVQFNWRLRVRCGSKQLRVACHKKLFIVGNKFCHTRWHTLMGVQ